MSETAWQMVKKAHNFSLERHELRDDRLPSDGASESFTSWPAQGDDNETQKNIKEKSRNDENELLSALNASGIISRLCEEKDKKDKK